MMQYSNVIVRAMQAIKPFSHGPHPKGTLHAQRGSAESGFFTSIPCVLLARPNNEAMSWPASNETGCAYTPRRSSVNQRLQKTAKANDQAFDPRYGWPTDRMIYSGKTWQSIAG